jgi:AraC-like DNA-binding protein
MWERYSEPLSLTDIAQSAILSRFHFSRVFRDETGVSPGRFLSAIRIYQAKRMLLNTSLNVTDISFAVGYNSLGSFTNHFTDSVGIPPGRFRRMAANGGFDPPALGLAQSVDSSAVAGTIGLPDSYLAKRVYVGVFDTPIIQRRPISAAIIEVGRSVYPCHYRLPNVPAGTWFLHAVAVGDSADVEPWTRRSLLVGRQGPVSVTVGDCASAPISLRLRNPTDLPILLALPDLEAEPEEIISYEAELLGSAMMPEPEPVASQARS